MLTRIQFIVSCLLAPFGLAVPRKKTVGLTHLMYGKQTKDKSIWHNGKNFGHGLSSLIRLNTNDSVLELLFYIQEFMNDFAETNEDRYKASIETWGMEFCQHKTLCEDDSPADVFLLFWATTDRSKSEEVRTKSMQGMTRLKRWPSIAEHFGYSDEDLDLDYDEEYADRVKRFVELRGEMVNEGGFDELRASRNALECVGNYNRKEFHIRSKKPWFAATDPWRKVR